MSKNPSLGALAASALSCCLPAAAQPVTVTDFNIVTPVFTHVYNDRIGNSRYFNGPNTDRVRVSAFALPSPDSDAVPVSPAAGGLYQSTNGFDTTVTVTHANFGPLGNPRALTFVGLSSGFGGGAHEYTTTFDRAAPAVAALLDAWDATPFTMTVKNPKAPNGISTIGYAAPDFDKNALPAFVTDLRVTGGGLNPRLDWAAPASGMTPSATTIQVRRINAESADRSRITSATLLHHKVLAANATSYTLDEVFSNAGQPGFPAGLEQGERYEISVQLEAHSPGGALLGRSRTLFEFAPLDPNAPNVAVYLPSVGPDGKFKFDVAVTQGQSIAIDPIVAVGYDYHIGAGDPNFRSVTLPEIGDGAYELWLKNGSGYSFKAGLEAGTEYFFDGLGVAGFRVLGIEASAGLDPSDVTAFVTTLSFAGSGRFTGTMTALTVPEPQTYAMCLMGLSAIGAWRRRRARWASRLA